MIAFGDANQIKHYSSSLTTNRVDHNVLTASEVNSVYSKQLKLPKDDLAVYSKNAGLVRAAVSVATLQVKFKINESFHIRPYFCSNCSFSVEEHC